MRDPRQNQTPLQKALDLPGSTIRIITMTCCNLACLRVQVLEDIRRVTKRPNYTPSDARDLCSKIFVTCYMASE